MPVISRHVGIEILPETLNGVVLWTIGRKEVKPNSAEAMDRPARLVAVVNPVVVEDDVDEASAGADLMELVEERHEERPRLLRTADPHDVVSASIEGAGNVRLGILAGCQYFLLAPRGASSPRRSWG